MGAETMTACRRIHPGVVLVALLSGFGVVLAQGQTAADSARNEFFNLRYAEALRLFGHAARAEPANAETRAYLADTYRRMGRVDDAIRTAREALSIDPCSAFAHCVLAQASAGNPDTVSAHARQAVACDSTDPNGWLMLWGEALRRGDAALHDHVIRKMISTGFFTPAALAYGRAELRTLPPNSILFTNGDMDTYPALAAQIGEGFRRDVTVVEREHLGIGWARHFLRTAGRVPFPLTEDQLGSLRDSSDDAGLVMPAATRVFRLMLMQKETGAPGRPIAIASTVSEDFAGPEATQFRNHGMFYLWDSVRSHGMLDTTSIRQCLEGIVAEEFQGSWTSPKDRSPVRRYYTDGLAGVVSGIALLYAQSLIEARRFSEAEETLMWAEHFERQTVMGYTSGDQIAAMRLSITSATAPAR